MSPQPYEEAIREGIKGLPVPVLAEIADFVYFLRKRARQPQADEDELRSALLHAELRQLSRESEAHLEQEFSDHEQRCHVGGRSPAAHHG